MTAENEGGSRGDAAFGGHRAPLQKSHSQRLRRLERVFPRTPIYFVTTCTAKRRPLLAGPSVHQTFLRFAERGEGRGAWVGAYVLMPDHLHLFLALDDRELLLGDWMKSLKNALSKALRQDGVPAPHWQKGFFDHVLRSDESYAEKLVYVRENPVRACLVKVWADWPYWGEISALDYAPE